MMDNNINPLDLLSGKVVQDEDATYWFKEPGNNMQTPPYGIILPKFENLHREDGPAVIYRSGDRVWFKNGVKVKSREHRFYTRKFLYVLFSPFLYPFLALSYFGIGSSRIIRYRFNDVVEFLLKNSYMPQLVVSYILFWLYLFLVLFRSG